MASRRAEAQERITARLQGLPSVRKDDRKASAVRKALAKGGRTNGKQA